MAWQGAFFVIASSPARFRLMMIPAIVEKLGYIIGTVVLSLRGRIPAVDASTAVPDFVLCVLFAIAFAKTATSGAYDSEVAMTPRDPYPGELERSDRAGPNRRLLRIRPLRVVRRRRRCARSTAA